MNRYIAVLSVVFAFAIGCATLEQSAYRSIGSVAVTVDASMQAWGDVVRAGQATAEQEATVRAVYVRYQAAMRTAQSALMAYKISSGQNKTELNIALDVLDGAAADIVALIRQFTKETR
jgi:hypothetical protein